MRAVKGPLICWAVSVNRNSVGTDLPTSTGKRFWGRNIQTMALRRMIAEGDWVVPPQRLAITAVATLTLEIRWKDESECSDVKIICSCLYKESERNFSKLVSRFLMA